MSTRCQIEFYDDESDEQGEPAARIYQHSDGYPDTKVGVLAQLKQLEKRLAGKDLAKLKKLPHFYDAQKTAADHIATYGSRLDDPEWAAAEYITMFRFAMGGNLYVSQHIHGDIQYLYRVVCTSKGLKVRLYTPQRDAAYGITSFQEVSPVVPELQLSL